jgi:penicillin amidase
MLAPVRPGLLACALSTLAAPATGGGEELAVSGLHAPVEILRDRWGVAHIYARDEHDLFFAQGYNIARDRLFQLELWRRQATGTLAEIQGKSALPRDIGARLL